MPKLWPRSWGEVLCLNIYAVAQKGLAGTLVHQLALLVIVLLLLPLSRQVCVAAVGNTRQKAQEVCRLFGQSLGKPLLIKEEETKEWGGHMDSYLPRSPDSLTLQERIHNATAYASSRVFAVFEIKGKENRRNKLL
ncbi:interleukin-1 receptor-associated kinase 1-binding protein 1 [Pitangus sulphuratus]|nr:interleukin-1 receptor-associated kinase 1-binding protein 1 [Pitangus sulphuratus]